MYKEIAKELLFNGADRKAETNQGFTARQLLEHHKEQSDNGIDGNEEDDEYDADNIEKYDKLTGILNGA